MKLVPSDPDLESVVRRIRQNELNLQPDFQRGEIWSLAKKQKLIDSILRNWYVPPVHIIVDEKSGDEEVLDGQQRLAAVRDFVNGRITVDGSIKPQDLEIQQLNGLTYEDLPQEYRRVFDRFTIRIFRIYDYDPDEPYELFFRLNQSVMLTAAEQRNTFFGEAREEVRNLVSYLEHFGLESQRIGFSNSRMAYDDILARLCVVLEHGTANFKVGAGLLTDRYRADVGFPQHVLNLAKESIGICCTAVGELDWPVKFNKATFFSWLYFIAQLIGEGERVPPKQLAAYLQLFETLRRTAKEKFSEQLSIMRTSRNLETVLRFVQEFNDRATARVWDTSSVLTRDAVIWIVLRLEHGDLGWPDAPDRIRKLSIAKHYLDDAFTVSAKEVIQQMVSDPSWS